MVKALIVDGEREGRKQLRYLLEQAEPSFAVQEAVGSDQALDCLEQFSCDIVFLDVTFSGLLEKIREGHPNLPVVVTCSFGEYSKAERLEHYGGVRCLVKPVDQKEFSALVKELCGKISEKKAKEEASRLAKEARDRYLLQQYLYGRPAEPPEGADLELWGSWHRAILIESTQPFFDMDNDDLERGLKAELHRNFSYLNVNANQSLLFFHETYCDYSLIGKHIYVYLKRINTARFYVAVSRTIGDYKELPDILVQLEQEMEERFYHDDEVHVFTSEEEQEKYVTRETQDSQLLQRISEDVSRKDVALLQKHFGVLVEKYRKQTQFSAMYVKFVFSNVLQELFQEPKFAVQRRLEEKVDELYACTDMGHILDLTGQEIKEYEIFLERSMKERRPEVLFVQDYSYSHPEEDLNLEGLSQKVKLSPGYLNFLFKKEFQVSLPRYIHVCRLEKARNLLEHSDSSVNAVSQKVGFKSSAYFVRAYRDYFGEEP